jgi:excinuclease ABC subunit B
MTPAMEGAIGETNRRRTIQEAYNKKHGITPKTIIKAIKDIAEEHSKLKLSKKKYDHVKIPKDEKKRMIEELEAQMDLAAKNMEFEKAADLRDEIELFKREL